MKADLGRLDSSWRPEIIAESDFDDGINAQNEADDKSGAKVGRNLQKKGLVKS